jgi:hypothetical protein
MCKRQARRTREKIRFGVLTEIIRRGLFTSFAKANLYIHLPEENGDDCFSSGVRLRGYFNAFLRADIGDFTDEDTFIVCI